eukprot:g1817.t1
MEETPIGNGIGRRFHGVDLSQSLTEEQAAVVLDALAWFDVVVFSGQDLERLDLARFETFANHFGAPVANLFMNQATAPGEPTMVEKMRNEINAIFPGQLTHKAIPEGSKAAFTVTNVLRATEGKFGIQKEGTKVRTGAFWHVDGEYEGEIPNNCSMFLVHQTPDVAASQTWVAPETVDRAAGHDAQYPPGADPELQRLRTELPLNSETAFANTAAAFEALPEEEQRFLETLVVRRRKYSTDVDDGWLSPLVLNDPRTGRKSLYSPLYGNRILSQGIPPLEVVGMSADESKALMERLETHLLQKRFRYDHTHHAGDVTVWSHFTLVHAAPPIKVEVDALEDARLYYRLSTKGPPSLRLPRADSPDWVARHVPFRYQSPIAAWGTGTEGSSSSI